LAISRRLNRSGEGEYRVNGARCRLVDVLELLSDTGLGKEAHSVISQGRVEAVVTSKPRDRRLLIEEAAGLGKHRKRRRRAQLKLERTAENLDRALDIEREARNRLRPLKRQAEAAELHERLERQSLEARWTLAREELRLRQSRLSTAEQAAAAAQTARDVVQSQLAGVAERRQQSELALAGRSERHDEIARRAYASRSTHDRLALRLERAHALSETLTTRATRRDAEAATLAANGEDEAHGGTARIEQLELELGTLDREREQRLEHELAALEQGREAAVVVVTELAAKRENTKSVLETADSRARAAREDLRDAERGVEQARREAARVGAELAGVNQFLRSHATVAGTEALEGRIQVRSGFEFAVAAALGGRLGAWLATDRGNAAALLDGAGEDGAYALIPVLGPAPTTSPPPTQGAEPLIDLVQGDGEALSALRRLLADTWLVDEIATLPDAFTGIAVTRAGRLWNGALGELTQAPSGGRERALEERNRRNGLIADAAAAAQAEQDALAASVLAQGSVQQSVEQRELAESTLRAADRDYAEALERERLAGWLIQQRRAAPDAGELAVRRAELDGELAAERRAAERVERERRARQWRAETLTRQAALDTALAPQLERFVAVLGTLGAALQERLVVFEQELAADRAAGDALATELRTCAGEETVLQARLRELADRVTTAEVQAQQARDQTAEADVELRALADRLGLDPAVADEPLDDEMAAALRDRVERLARRREQLGPVNPLAAEEYKEALERVEELEAQRTDLETALRELGVVIRDADRQITESFETTFAAAAQNFEDLIEDVFPGGRGRLRLVREEKAPQAVLGGQQTGESGEQAAEHEAAEAEAAAEGEGSDDTLGVEIEVTPAGKATKRLSLLSGGEKSMTAIAFLFAVFLARPCPFYILDEVEAALDDLNIDRFLALLRRHSTRAQFIVVTHQKRTMEAADWLYGVSMGSDGTSKVISRRLGADGLSELEEPAGGPATTRVEDTRRDVEHGRVASLPAADAA
jgi:chromosome segregation protein